MRANIEGKIIGRRRVRVAKHTHRNDVPKILSYDKKEIVEENLPPSPLMLDL